MKKTILIMMVLVACLTLASVASAEYLITSPTGTAIGGSTFVPSTNVGIDVKATAVAYCAVAQNSSSDLAKGGKQYGTTSGSSTLKSQNSLSDATTPTSLGTPCTDASNLPNTFQ